MANSEFNFIISIDTNPIYSMFGNNENVGNYDIDFDELLFNHNDYHNIDFIIYNGITNINHIQPYELLNNFINNYENISGQQFETEDGIIPINNYNIRPNIEVIIDNIELLSEDSYFCCICMETRENNQVCQLNCLHKYCDQCIETHITKTRSEPRCPLCRNLITEIKVQNENIFQKFKII